MADEVGEMEEMNEKKSNYETVSNVFYNICDYL
jgi:hypothetical protein